MFPQSLKQCQPTLETARTKAIDALTLATAAQLGLEFGAEHWSGPLDATQQQKIEGFWERNFEALLQRAIDTTHSTPYKVGDTVLYLSENGGETHVQVLARREVGLPAMPTKPGFDGIRNGCSVWGYDSGVVRVVR